MYIKLTVQDKATVSFLNYAPFINNKLMRVHLLWTRLVFKFADVTMMFCHSRYKTIFPYGTGSDCEEKSPGLVHLKVKKLGWNALIRCSSMNWAHSLTCNKFLLLAYCFQVNFLQKQPLLQPKSQQITILSFLAFK